MKKGKRSYKKRNGICRWLALFMTAVLVISNESHLTVLAEEAGDGALTCICESKCSADAVNADCPVCAGNYEACAVWDDAEPGDGNEDAGGENTDTDNNIDDGAGDDDPVGDDGVDEPELLENDEQTAEEQMEAVAEENGIAVYAVGDEFEGDNGIRYKVIPGDGQVEVKKYQGGTVEDGRLVIPETVTDRNGSTYRVTSIGDYAFSNCSSLSNIEIPNSVTSIGDYAFSNCSSLSSIEIPNSVTSIRDYAFKECSSLSSIEIPNHVTSIGKFTFWGCYGLSSVEIPNSVTSIGDYAFTYCHSLSSIKIPNSVTSIGKQAFAYSDGLSSIEILGSGTSIEEEAFTYCHSLSSIKILGSVTSIGALAFHECINLKTLQIAVTPNLQQLPSVAVDGGRDSFHETPDDRSLEFVAEDGTALSDDLLQRAQEAYRSDARDGDDNDNLWWGWKIGGTISPGTPSFRVSLKVQKDDEEWTGHGKTFKLLDKNSNTLIADFETVSAGEYPVYDVTGMADDAVLTDDRNTGVIVSVVNRDVEATVDYYTVTFYDGTTAYADDTPQAPQLILKGKPAIRPADPSKEGYRFRQWVTTDNGNEAFRFDVPIIRTSIAYAAWNSKAVDEYIIKASAGEGGSIFPEGDVRVEDGGGQIFEITPDDGCRIKTVTVDGEDRTAALTDGAVAGAVRAQSAASRHYTFSNVKENHTIIATFEKAGSGGNEGGDGGDNGNTGGNEGTGGGNNGSIGNDNTPAASGTPVISVNHQDSADSSGGDEGTGASPSANTPRAREPKTGDDSPVEIYATVAMISGLAYLILYFADKGGGMTEDEKQKIIMKLIRWAKNGRRIRRYLVLVPIFLLLFYYHSIGKRVYVEREEELCIATVK